jgi:Holliday junction DNA helicase RuvB
MTRKEINVDELVVHIADPVASPTDRANEGSLRPVDLGEFIGQGELVNHLSIVLRAARARNQPPDHILLSGPPGLGKTSLAGIVASELGVALRITSGPVLTRPGDVAALLTDLSDNEVLFIDEIHRLSRTVEEVLYPAMEDRRLDVMIGRGPSARSIRLELPHFTLVGATTRTGLVAAPLRDRFGFVGQLDFYSVDELTRVVERSAKILDIEISTAAARLIASRSRGTPRIANRLLRRVRDFANVHQRPHIDPQAAEDALTTFGIDELGLDKVDRRILEALCHQFAHQPVGVATLAHVIGEEAHTVEESYEPFLLREGLLSRSNRGRVATEKAYRHLGLEKPQN